MSDQAIDSQPLSSQAWIVRVANPNATPNSKPNNDVDCEIRISPLANTWTFTGADGNWSGSKGSDGRIFCAPYSLLDYEPAMVGDFILELLQGLMVVVFSGDGETHQITDTPAARTSRQPCAGPCRRARWPPACAQHLQCVAPGNPVHISHVLSILFAIRNSASAVLDAHDTATQGYEESPERLSFVLSPQACRLRYLS